MHEIGNKLRDEQVFFSEALQNIDSDLESVLLKYFLKPFLAETELFNLGHSSDINLNEVYSYSRELFYQNDEAFFIGISQNIAKYLYEYTTHPKITKGELIIVKISDVIFDDKKIELIGIFKSDNKEPFLKMFKDKEFIAITGDIGINISKLDKGCVILNTNEKEGFRVLNIDNYRQSTDYWTNKFLNLKPINNNSYKTKEVIKLCKGFSKEVLSTKYDAKMEITFNNDFVSYLEESSLYDLNSFTEAIFREKKVKNEFFEYQKANAALFDVDINEKFELSKRDVKKEKKRVNNTIRLDTKLELKVLLSKDGGTNNIEKGYDKEKKMFFYKVYFNKELD